MTGASSGIGAQLAREAAKDGHDLVLVARRREPMQALAGELHAAGTEITVISTDLGEPGSAAELMKIIEDRGLVIDTLINNAGLGDSGRFDQTDPQKIAAMLQVNVVAVTELDALWVAAKVARRRGKIMLVASTAAFQPGPGMAVYYATKAYVLSFGRAIGYEPRRTGVTVTTICPVRRRPNSRKRRRWKAPYCSAARCRSRRLPRWRAVLLLRRSRPGVRCSSSAF